MATLGASVRTLEELAKGVDPESKKVMLTIEILAQENAILKDMGFKYGNLDTGHRVSIRTGLPDVYWKRYNEGVLISKSQKATVDEKTGMMEAWAEIDEDLAKLGDRLSENRFDEATAFIEAMGQEAASTIIYGNSAVNPEQFDGLAFRYSDPTAPNGQNMIDAGGTTAVRQTSIWLVTHNDQTFHGIVPKGSKVGLEHKDHGLKTIEDGNLRKVVYQDQFKWHLGIVLKDWRYVVRICNIDVEKLVDEDNTYQDVIGKAMVKALHKLPSRTKGKQIFYMNATVETFLDLERWNKVAGAGMQYPQQDGQFVNHFRGTPIHRMDCLLNTEAVISF